MDPRAFGRLDRVCGRLLPRRAALPRRPPATTSTAEAFIDRMKGLAKTEMPSFTVSYLGSDIQAFGNAAVAFAAIEMVKNA